MTVSLSQIEQMRLAVGDTMAATITVETFAGNSGTGPVFSTAVKAIVMVVTARRLVRNEAGEEVVSELTLYAPASDLDKFTPHSRVTVNSRKSAVLSVCPKEFRGMTAVLEVTCI